MLQTDLAMRLAAQRATDLQRLAGVKNPDYPDRERFPRILRHWTNR